MPGYRKKKTKSRSSRGSQKSRRSLKPNPKLKKKSYEPDPIDDLLSDSPPPSIPMRNHTSWNLHNENRTTDHSAFLNPTPRPSPVATSPAVVHDTLLPSFPTVRHVDRPVRPVRSPRDRSESVRSRTHHDFRPSDHRNDGMFSNGNIIIGVAAVLLIAYVVANRRST